MVGVPPLDEFAVAGFNRARRRVPRKVFGSRNEALHMVDIDADRTKEPARHTRVKNNLVFGTSRECQPWKLTAVSTIAARPVALA